MGRKNRADLRKANRSEHYSVEPEQVVRRASLGAVVYWTTAKKRPFCELSSVVSRTMVNSHMTRYICPLLLLALAAGCTERPTTPESPKSPEVVTPSPVAQAPAQSQGASEAEDEGTVADPEPVNTPVAETQRIDIEKGKRVIPEHLKNMSPWRRERTNKILSEMGEVKLEIPDGPATADALEPGRYFLSISMLLSNGRPMKNQRPCQVLVEGPNVKIVLENSQADPIVATFEDGDLFSEPRLGPGTYGLEGRMVGPGKMRGTIIPGPIPHPSIDIVEGRWGLDVLPLRKTGNAEEAGSAEKAG